MQKSKKAFTLALFYCRNTPGSSERERQALEAEYRGGLRLFPLPCSGRMEPIHLMKALEEFADAAYLIACPEGVCRYQEGNTRARKRVARTAQILEGVGLERERVGMVANAGDDPQPLETLAGRIMGKVGHLGPSPVLHSRTRPKGDKDSGKTAGRGNAKKGRRPLSVAGNRTAEMVRMEQR